MPPDMVRLSIGLESIDDILWDLEQALAKASGMRPAILFVALVVMATATFLGRQRVDRAPFPAMRQLPIAARIALLYVPYAILVAILWFYARMQSRVQGNIAWFIALAIFAVGTILTPYVTPALMLAIALVL